MNKPLEASVGRTRWFFTAFQLCLIVLLAWAPKAWAVSPPTISPGTGLYLPGPTVTLSATGGATIYFTLDNSIPTTNSQVYSSSLTINASTTVNAIAVLSGVSSSVATQYFQVDPTIGILYPDMYNANLWLRSDVGVTSSSGKVSNWLDLSIQSHSASQSTSANQPSIVSDDYNGFPAITTGTNQYFNLPPDISTASNRMINPNEFFVTKPTGTSNGNLLDWGNGSASNNVTASSSGSTAELTIFTGSTPTSLSASGALSLGQYQILNVSDLTGTGQILVNDNQVATGSLSTPNDLTRTVNHIGTDYSGSANFYSGSFLEILSWGNSRPNDAVIPYLLARYQPSTALPSAPIISVPAGTLLVPTQVAIAAPPDCTVRYTADGSTPSPTTSPMYAGPIQIYFSQTLKAIAIKNGISSSVASASYTLDSAHWPAPDPSDTTPLQLYVQSPTN